MQQPDYEEEYEVDQPMSLELARSMTGKDGKKYGDCTLEEIDGKIIGLSKIVNDDKYGREDQDKALNKLEALKIVKQSMTAQQEPLI